ncbi:hypothetical protein G6F23_015589 [Rhizopus arrhizus]|nr:hypothetical protein G6F23_015589 [Rhizopus arrhizus]
MAVVSVGAALAQMMLDEDKRELFKYRAEQDCTHEDGVYRDIFDGKIQWVKKLMQGIAKYRFYSWLSMDTA